MMKRSRLFLYGLMGVALTSIFAGIRIYYQPARIEDLDSMLYCACGYSRVRFESGRIVMVRSGHEFPKPGDQIGTYRTDGTRVEIGTGFGAARYQEVLRLDHIGLIEPPDPSQRSGYRAINTRSWKTKVYGILEKVGERSSSWTWEMRRHLRKIGL
jgi:hypothetical protein